MKRPDKIQLTIELGNADMHTPKHVAEVLRHAAASFLAYGWEAKARYRDENGNTVAKLEFDWVEKPVEVVHKTVHFPKCDAWVAFAWNYDEAFVATTPQCSSERIALDELESIVHARGAVLGHFEGSFNCAGNDGCMIPTTSELA